MAAFTAVAAGVGLAVTAATTAASFAQMAEEKEKKKKAEDAAAAAMMEARKKLDVNYYEQLGIQKEPYELARREMLVQGAMATEALKEGDPRALAAGVGRVQLAQQAGQEKVTTAMQQEQSQLEKLVAGEESRLRDLDTQLDLQEVVGAQQAMADAARAEQMALQQGLAGVTSMAGQVASMAPLYSKSPEVNALNRIKRQAARNPDIDINTLNLSDRASLEAAGIKLTDKQFASIPSNINTVSDFEAYVTPKYEAKTKGSITPDATKTSAPLNPTPLNPGEFGDLKSLWGNPAFDPNDPFNLNRFQQQGLSLQQQGSFDYKNPFGYLLDPNLR
tara:strand:- start:155 stop:1153 length:999 start_codon:yes stop_codon:yes gene_type:complete